MKPKGCGPRNLGSPFKQTARQNKTVEPATNKTFKESDKKTIQDIQGPSKEDTFTPNYNAATGFTIDKDPSYNYDRREAYKKNAIKKHGSLKNARAAYGGNN